MIHVLRNCFVSIVYVFFAGRFVVSTVIVTSLALSVSCKSSQHFPPRTSPKNLQVDSGIRTSPTEPSLLAEPDMPVAPEPSTPAQSSPGEYTANEIPATVVSAAPSELAFEPAFELPATPLLAQPITPVEVASIVAPIIAKHKPSSKLVIAGVRRGSGNIKIAIYDSAISFLDLSAAHVTLELPADKSTLETTLPGDNLNTDRFAVAVYQDINADGELNRNQLGVPTEPFAFSNNAMGKRGPPTFEQAAIHTDDLPTTVKIQLPQLHK